MRVMHTCVCVYIYIVLSLLLYMYVCLHAHTYTYRSSCILAYDFIACQGLFQLVVDLLCCSTGYTRRCIAFSYIVQRLVSKLRFSHWFLTDNMFDLFWYHYFAYVQVFADIVSTNVRIATHPTSSRIYNIIGRPPSAVSVLLRLLCSRIGLQCDLLLKHVELWLFLTAPGFPLTLIATPASQGPVASFPSQALWILLFLTWEAISHCRPVLFLVCPLSWWTW